MINLTGVIEMTAVLYLPQFTCSADKHYNDEFYVTGEHLKKMYLLKYSRNYNKTALHTFKAVML